MESLKMKEAREREREREYELLRIKEEASQYAGARWASRRICLI